MAFVSAGATGGAAGSGGTDAGADSGTDSGTDAGTACAGMTQQGTQVTPQNVSGTLPTPAGGTIVIGTYVLTAAKFYNQTSTSPADTQTVLVKAGANASTFDVSLLHGATGCETATWTVSGTNVTIQMLTPQNQNLGSFGYTATSTELHIFKASADREQVYTLK